MLGSYRSWSIRVHSHMLGSPRTRTGTAGPYADRRKAQSKTTKNTILTILSTSSRHHQVRISARSYTWGWNDKFCLFTAVFVTTSPLRSCRADGHILITHRCRFSVYWLNPRASNLYLQTQTISAKLLDCRSYRALTASRVHSAHHISRFEDILANPHRRRLYRRGFSSSGFRSAVKPVSVYDEADTSGNPACARLFRG